MRVTAVLVGGLLALMGVFGVIDSLGQVNGIPDPGGMPVAVVMTVGGLFAGVLRRRR